MKNNIDWDAPDDEGVIDFEGIEEMAHPPAFKPKLPQVEPPKTTQKVHVEPPPKKVEVGMSEKQEKIITNATKSAQKLSKELETLDFQIEKFTKFEKKVSSFKIKNTIAVGAVALFLGGYIGSLAQSELNNYYINQELQHKLEEATTKLKILQNFEDAGFGFADTNDVLQVYSKDPKVQLYESQGFKILQFNKK